MNPPPPRPDRTGTISFVKNKRSVFECHPIEKSRLIYQIGSSDPELALKAAKLVEQDVWVPMRDPCRLTNPHEIPSEAARNPAALALT